MPTSKEVREFLDSEAYALTLDQMQDNFLVNMDGNVLTIGKGLEEETSITRMPDGAVTTSGKLSLQLLSQTNHRYDPFNATMEVLKQMAQRHLTGHLRRMLGLANNKKRCMGPPEELGRQPRSTEELMGSKTTAREIARVARNVLSELGNGYVNNPIALGYSMLHQLLDRDDVLLTLKMAGSHADLENYNRVVTNREALREAHRTNPNAVLAWINSNAHPDLRQAAGMPAPNIPGELVDQVRQEFARYVQVLEQNRSQNFAKGFDNGRTAQLWKQFPRLNHRGVNASMPSIPNMIQLCSIAHELETKHQMEITCTALIAITKAMNNHSITPRAFHTAYAIRSAQPMRKRGITQRRLRNIFESINQQSIHGLCNGSEQGDALIRLGNHWVTNWDTWLETIPEATERALTDADEMDRQAAERSQARRRARPRKKTRYATLTPELSDRIYGEIAPSLVGCAHVESEPGVSASLHGEEGTEPALKLTRQLNGIILTESAGYWTGGTALPAPDRMEMMEAVDHRRQSRMPELEEPNSGGLAPESMNWTTRGLAQRTALRITGRKFRELRPGEKLSLNRLASKMRKYQSTLPANRQMPSDQELSRMLREAVRTLVDPGIMELARTMTNHVTTDRYNIAAIISLNPENLGRVNSGAMEWLMAYGQVNEPLNHPGQLITIARASMAEHGILPGNWKFVAGLSPELMQAITREKAPEEAAHLLNLMARTRAVPSPHITKFIAETALPKIFDEDLPGTPRSQNIDAAISLLCQESRNLLRDSPDSGTMQNELENTAGDVIDYAQTRGIGEIQSTRWKGLLEKSELWRRNTGARAADENWNNILNRQQGRYLAWNSLIKEPVELDGYSAEPLTNEKHLYRESANMDHCVIGYGEKCARGRSRIFSITQQGQKAATGEIVMGRGAWEPIQTRGRHNHPVDRVVDLLMLKVAQEYTQLYRSRKSDRHSSWMVHDETGETTPTQDQRETGKPGLPAAQQPGIRA